MYSLRWFSQRFLLLKTMFLVPTIRVSLLILPFHIIQGYIIKMVMKPVKRNKIDQRRLNLIAGYVVRISHFVPGATCLTQALATLVLLNQYSCPAKLRIGVARNKAGKFEAHAWIESDGIVVIGGTKSDLYERYSLLSLT